MILLSGTPALWGKWPPFLPSRLSFYDGPWSISSVTYLGFEWEWSPDRVSHRRFQDNPILILPGVITNHSYVGWQWGKKEQVEQKETQDIHFKEKRSTKKFIWAKTCAKRDEEIRERPGLKWNKMGVPTGHDPTWLSCQLVKEKDLGSFLFLKSNNKGNAEGRPDFILSRQPSLAVSLSFSEGYTTKEIGESSSVVQEHHWAQRCGRGVSVWRLWETSGQICESGAGAVLGTLEV